MKVHVQVNEQGALRNGRYAFSNRYAEQTTFSIPIPGCRDRVPVAPAAR